MQSYIAAHPGSWVLKSQVMMGGRGKAGGIKFADDAAQGETLARELIGKVLKSVQNPDGEEVKSLLVEEKVDIASEAYVSIAIDRAAKKPVVLVTAQGGMDVEEVAERDPDAIAKYWIDPAAGYSPFIGRQLAFRAKLPDGYRKAFPSILGALYTLFMDYGANLVEINPLVLTKDGRVIASDAKVDLDDNGLYKHPDIAAVEQAAAGRRRSSGGGRDRPRDVELREARRHDRRDRQRRGPGHGHDGRDPQRRRRGGELPRHRRRRASRAGEEELQPRDERSQGAARCSSTSSAASRAAIRSRKASSKRSAGDDVRKVPLVVRLTGTNAEEGRAILAEAGFVPVETMDEGAARAVALANGSN